jgi:hypothetical protein
MVASRFRSLAGIALELRPRTLLSAAALGFGIYLAFRTNADGPALLGLSLVSYAGVLGSVLLYAAACFAVGFRVYGLLVRAPAPVFERVAIGWALGVLIFGQALFLIGLVRLGPPLFGLLPTALLLAAGSEPWRFVWRTRRLVQRARKSGASRTNPWFLPLVALGVAGLLMLFLPTLSPAHLGYDSAWYHLPVAEQYAVLGRVSRFEEGWYQGTQPQLASLLYTWAFTSPFAMADKVILCMQLEFAGFVPTILGVAELARRLGARFPGRMGWVALFAFPSLFFYDFVAAGDHVAALFAAPSLLLLFRFQREPTWGRAVALAGLASGALLTKYTAAILVVPLVAWLGLRLAGLGLTALRSRDRAPVVRLARALGVFALVSLVLTSTHWLKNLIWYGDPLYPVGYKLFRPNPWHVDAAAVFEAWKRESLWKPEASLSGLWEAARETLLFPFVGHDFPVYTKGIATNGMLFGVVCLALPLVRPPRRLLGAVALVYTAVFVWYFIHHNDRYLQAILPVQAAALAAIVSRLWSTGLLLRAMILPLVAVQSWAAAEVFYFPNRHAWMRDLEQRFSAPFRGATIAKQDYFLGWPQLGRSLPRNAKLLVHEQHIHLGVNRPVVADWIQWQGAINYGRLKGHGSMTKLLHKLGVTHITLVPAHATGWDSLASDLMFFSYVYAPGRKRQTIGSREVVTVPSTRERDVDDWVAVLSCGHGYQTGFYRRSRLTVPPQVRDAVYPLPDRPLDATGTINLERLGDATLLVRNTSCRYVVDADVSKAFPTIARRSVLELRRRL